MSRNRRTAASQRKRLVLIIVAILLVAGAVAWDLFYDPNVKVYARCQELTLDFLGLPEEDVTLPEYDPETVTHSVEGGVRVLTYPVEWVEPDGEVWSDHMHCIRDQNGFYQVYPHSWLLDPELDLEGPSGDAQDGDGSTGADGGEPETGAGDEDGSVVNDEALLP